MEARPKKPVKKAAHHAVKKTKAVKDAHPKPEHEAKTEPLKVAHGKNYYAVGRRKTAVAQILLSLGDGVITLNHLLFESYFQTEDLRQIVLHPLRQLGLEKQINVKGKIHGGGIHAQAESLRHAISRALILLNPDSRRTLKKLGFLTRDSRVKERKKPGLKRARRAPQFSKR